MQPPEPRGRPSSAHPAAAPETDSDGHHRLDPQKARQGQIILKTSIQRWIFFGALALAIILGITITILA